MDLSEYLALRAAAEQQPTLSAAEITGPDRTLLYGFTCDRATWHVYLDSGQIHLLVYFARSGSLVRHEAREVWPAAELLPDKRVYPESTDHQVAVLLQSRGQHPPYRAFDEARRDRLAARLHHGATYDPATGGLRHTDFP
jgi:hypothetical protein